MTEIKGPDIEQQIGSVVAELTDEFGDRIGRDHIRYQEMANYRRLEGSKVKTFVPILTRRAARTPLRELA
jgi:hypothetical protein